MPTKSNAATGQWNQILCRPVKTLIRIRKPEIMRVAAIGRGRFANQSGTPGDGGFGRLASQVVRQAGIGWQGSNHGALPGWVGIVK